MKKYGLMALLMATLVATQGQAQVLGKTTTAVGYDDLRYLRSRSTMIKNMEDSLRITSTNMPQRISITDAMQLPVVDTQRAILYLPSGADLDTAMFAYARQMSKAMQWPFTKKYLAMAKKKTLTRNAFADSVGVVESKAIFNSILVGLETGTTQKLPYPTSIINAAIDKVKGKINGATALYMIFNYVKNKAAAPAGPSLYRAFLEFYDRWVQ